MYKEIVVRGRIRKAKLCFKDINKQSLTDMLVLFHQAKADFPKLDIAMVDVGLAGNSFCPEQIGIIFDVPDDWKIPQGYSELKFV